MRLGQGLVGGADADREIPVPHPLCGGPAGGLAFGHAGLPGTPRKPRAGETFPPPRSAMHRRRAEDCIPVATQRRASAGGDTARDVVPLLAHPPESPSWGGSRYAIRKAQIGFQGIKHEPAPRACCRGSPRRVGTLRRCPQSP